MALSRRRMLQAGAGLVVAGAIPTGMHIAWNGRSFEREGYVPGLPEAPDGETSWMNWSGIERATPKAIEFPASDEALADLLRSTDLRVRPVGAGHSFTGLAPSEGLMINLSGMEGLLGYDPATGHATFAAGTRLYHAAEELDRLGRAFPNLPDINVQTLAGSFSTATHGTGNTLTALHDYIVSFRMVTASGEILDVDASQPDLFEAGKVSLGALGVMTQYTLKTVPSFRLNRKVTALPVEDFLDQIEALGQAHRNFEFYYLPGTGKVASITHDLVEGEGGAPPEPADGSEDDELLQGLNELRDTFGWFPWLRRKIAGAALPSGVVEDVTDESWALLATTRPTRFIEMEYHLPRENGVDTVRKIIRALDHRKEVFFPMEYRHIAPDTAWLSPFNDGPRSSIAVHAAANERYDYFFTGIEPIHRAAGGRPHWGKLHSLGRAELEALYPKFGDFMALRRELDPAGQFLNPHLAKLFGEDFDG